MGGKSAGILLYRYRKGRLEVFLVHPGGPYWMNRDRAAWSIPKGEFPDGEDPLEAAKREFREETGFSAEGDFLFMGERRQAGGKRVYVWALEGDCDPAAIESNLFKMEWPPKSGKYRQFPEVDRAGWFPVEAAREKLHKGQAGFIEKLLEKLGSSGGS
jgi:predicted NUDIX family NTP pyrophosphohydrolase